VIHEMLALAVTGETASAQLLSDAQRKIEALVE
jgi:hypothetical protein